MHKTGSGGAAFRQAPAQMQHCFIYNEVKFPSFIAIVSIAESRQVVTMLKVTALNYKY